MVENITFSLSKPIIFQNSKHHVFEFSAKQWEWKDWWCFECKLFLAERSMWCFEFCRGGRKTWCFLSSTTFSLAKEKIWCFWWNTYGFFLFQKSTFVINENNITQNWNMDFFFFWFFIIYQFKICDVLMWQVWKTWCFYRNPLKKMSSF